MDYHTKLWSELFVLSLCILVSFSARSPAPGSSRRSEGNAVQQRQPQQAHQQQQPRAPLTSAARRTESSVNDPWQSSGDNFDDDEEDLDFSGDDRLPGAGGPTDLEDDDENFGEDDEQDIIDEEEEEEEGSTEVTEDVPPSAGPASRTRCQVMSSSRPPYQGAYRPQCDANGAFMPTQCHESTGECWCVDPDGNVRGTVYRSPERPSCVPDSRPRPPAFRPTPADDITLVDTKTSVRPDTDIKSTTEDEEENSPEVEPIPPKTWYEYILREPLLLTAIIAGTVLFLIIIVLMLTFCVYRMRKKDEGSYSLDEPRQTFNYTRAKDQEFFA